MTESEWLNETGRSQWMVLFLIERKVARTKVGRRKLRLFACGCCRFAWDLLPDDRLRVAIRTAERFADGLATKSELAAARASVEELRRDRGPFGDSPIEVRVAIDMAVETTHASATEAAFYMTATRVPLAGAVPADAESILCHLIRCVFGNPFRATLGRPWPSATATELARGIYDDRAFDRLPVLADSLEEDGCDDTDLLAHGRGEGPHTRGCWVVDLALGMK